MACSGAVTLLLALHLKLALLFPPPPLSHHAQVLGVVAPEAPQ